MENGVGLSVRASFLCRWINELRRFELCGEQGSLFCVDEVRVPIR